jgi:hypothetical protein
MAKLTVFSIGMGQDSVALANMYFNDADFRAQYAPEDVVMVFADTGNEHPETDEYREHFAKLCAEHGVEFVFLTPDMGFHADSYRSLVSFFKGEGRKNNLGRRGLMTKTYVKSCSDRLKIQPIYRWLSSYVASRYDIPAKGPGPFKGKYPLVEFARRYGKIDIIIGISGGEEKRMAKPSENDPKWRTLSVNTVYPLVDLGMDRAACQAKIASYGQPVPLPSNCLFCPFLSEMELIWLVRHYPERYQEWVEHEAAKVACWKDEGIEDEKNHGVWGKKLLPQVLAEALAKYGHLSDAEVDEYKMSHGHCLMTKY